MKPYEDFLSVALNTFKADANLSFSIFSQMFVYLTISLKRCYVNNSDSFDFLKVESNFRKPLDNLEWKIHQENGAL